MTGITIRPARPEDYAAIADLTVAAYNELEGEHSDAYLEYIQMLRNVEGRARDTEVLVAADEKDTVLGSVTLVLDTTSGMAEWEESNAAGFRMLAVAPDKQGKGVGRALTEYCIARAREAGKDAVLIHSRDVMNTARGMYERMGFVRHWSIDFQVQSIRLEGFRLDL